MLGHAVGGARALRHTGPSRRLHVQRLHAHRLHRRPCVPRAVAGERGRLRGAARRQGRDRGDHALPGPIEQTRKQRATDSDSLKRGGNKMKAIALAVLALAMLGPARAADYRFLSTWDKSYPAVPGMADPFIKNLEAATQGRIKLIVSGPEAVSPYEQLEPVSAGVFQFLFTAGAYHYGTTPFLSAVEALGGTPESRVTAGVLDVVDRHYEKYGLKLIALAMEND